MGEFIDSDEIHFLITKHGCRKKSRQNLESGTSAYRILPQMCTSVDQRYCL